MFFIIFIGFFIFLWLLFELIRIILIFIGVKTRDQMQNFVSDAMDEVKVYFWDAVAGVCLIIPIVAMIPALILYNIGEWNGYVFGKSTYLNSLLVMEALFIGFILYRVLVNFIKFLLKGKEQPKIRKF